MHPASYLFLKSECNVLQVNRCSTKAKFLDKTLLSTDTHTHQKKKRRKKKKTRKGLSSPTFRPELGCSRQNRPVRNRKMQRLNVMPMAESLFFLEREREKAIPQRLLYTSFRRKVDANSSGLSRDAHSGRSTWKGCRTRRTRGPASTARLAFPPRPT